MAVWMGTSGEDDRVRRLEDDIGQERRQRAALRVSFPDDDPRAVRHHHRRLQHRAHQSDYPAIRHALTDAVERAPVMNSIEELGQIEIHHRPVAGFEVLLASAMGITPLHRTHEESRLLGGRGPVVVASCRPAACRGPDQTSTG